MGASGLDFGETPETYYLMGNNKNAIVTVYVDTYLTPLTDKDVNIKNLVIKDNSGKVVFEFSEKVAQNYLITPGKYHFSVEGPENQGNVLGYVFNEYVTSNVAVDTVGWYELPQVPDYGYSVIEDSSMFAFMRGKAESARFANVIDGKENVYFQVLETYRNAMSFIPANKTVTFKNVAENVNIDLLSKDRPIVQSGEIEYEIKDNAKLDTTMGEAVVSLRAVTRKFNIFKIFENSSTILLDTINMDNDGSLGQALVDVISYMYRFVSGSIRYKIVTDGLQNVTLYSSERGIVGVMQTNAPSHIQQCDLNPIIEVEQPFYSPAENLVMGSKTFETYTNGISKINVTAIDGKKHKYTALKAAGDDMSFSFLVGAPVFFVGPDLPSNN